MQLEGLESAICYLGLLFKSIPAGVVAEPQQIAVDVGHLPRDADLVAVEVVGLLAAFSIFGCPVVYQCQGFVRIRFGVDIGIATVKYGTKKIV